MDLAIYGQATRLYKRGVSKRLSVGDLIRKTRDDKGWNQTELGEKASAFVIARTTRINKSTVSKVERNPYSSAFETVWRLLAALDLTLADVEREVGVPFKRDQAPAATAADRSARSTPEPDDDIRRRDELWALMPTRESRTRVLDVMQSYARGGADQKQVPTQPSATAATAGRSDRGKREA